MLARFGGGALELQHETDEEREEHLQRLHLREPVVSRVAKRFLICDQTKPDDADCKGNDHLSGGACAEQDERASEDHLAKCARNFEVPRFWVVLLIHAAERALVAEIHIGSLHVGSDVVGFDICDI